MCGIYGWLGEPVEGADKFLATASRLLAHRGPDDQGDQRAPDWALGFRRLAILDLSPAGHQPMSTPDGRYWLVFNGEVYNHVELRSGLERRGIRLRGHSDTEVVLWMLALDGASALEAFNGMFALAFVDAHRGTFLLARDRLGVKPLHYHASNGHLRFASELKALLGWPGAPATIAPHAVVQYLALGYLSGDTCIFNGYQKLAPGHALIGDLARPDLARSHRYWTLELDSGARATADVDELGALLEDAVRIRLRSDVPVGVFLSGGLDSGVVTVLAATAARSKGGQLPLALTVGFTEEHYDESALAAATAAKAGLEHQVVVQRFDALDELDRLAWFYDEPFGDSSALPSFALAEAAAKFGIVFLSGDGGDEAFAGYRRYAEALRYAGLARLPRPAARFSRNLAGLLPPTSAWRYRTVKATAADQGFAAAFDVTPEDPALAVIVHPDLAGSLEHAGAPLWQAWADSAGADLTTRQQALDYALYLPDDILVKVDRASMAHSVEVRSPFLDYRVVEWAARLPRRALLADGTGKLPLRELARRLLPQPVLDGVKRGFSPPLDSWFREKRGQQFARERLIDGDARRLNLWNPAGVDHLLRAHRSDRSRSFGSLIWRLLMLEAWTRHYGSQAFLAGPPGH